MVIVASNVLQRIRIQAMTVWKVIREGWHKCWARMQTVAQLDGHFWQQIKIHKIAHPECEFWRLLSLSSNKVAYPNHWNIPCGLPPFFKWELAPPSPVGLVPYRHELLKMHVSHNSPSTSHLIHPWLLEAVKLFNSLGDLRWENTKGLNPTYPPSPAVYGHGYWKAEHKWLQLHPTEKHSAGVRLWGERSFATQQEDKETSTNE